MTKTIEVETASNLEWFRHGAEQEKKKTVDIIDELYYAMISAKVTAPLAIDKAKADGAKEILDLLKRRIAND
jgi:hypothetical protein